MFSVVDNNKRFKMTLTDANGLELTPDTDMTSMYVQSTLDPVGATMDWYLSHNGELDAELVNIRVVSNASVAVTSYGLYYFALGAWKSAPAYSTSLTGAQALAGISTSYALTEDIPSGSKLKFSVTTAGACTIGVEANGRK